MVYSRNLIGDRGNLRKGIDHVYVVLSELRRQKFVKVFIHLDELLSPRGNLHRSLKKVKTIEENLSLC